MNEKYLELETGRIHLIQEGNPKDGTLIFIHAFPLQGKIWQSQLNSLSSLKQVIAYDIRGFGKSPLGSGNVSIETYCEDLFQLIQKLQVKKPIVCGLSMGGYIALRAQEKYPGLFSGVILADTRQGEDSPEGKQKRFATIEQLCAGKVNEFAEGFLKNALSEQTLEASPEIFSQLKEMILNQPIEGITAALKAMANRSDTSRALTNGPPPTLIIVGEKDKLTTLDHASEMQKLNPKAELHKIPGAGHLSNMESPEAFNEILRAFLKSNF